MRLGVHLGPFYAGTSTGRRRGGSGTGSLILGFFFLLLLIGWPFLLGQKPNGGYHTWVWAIAIPWWILLALAVAGWLAGSKAAAAKAAEEDQQRMEAARQELAARQAAALEEARQTGWLRLDSQTADAYAGVTPDGRSCHHRHRSPEAAAECAARLAKAA